MMWRFFHSSRIRTVAQSSLLAKLRKSTGYPMLNCKKALELHPDNLQKAEEWLHAEAKKQGWSKITNLQHRVAGQGLIGVCTTKNVGAMVEVNCETDFVARNIEFQSLVEKILSSCVEYANKQNIDSDFEKICLEENNLNNLTFGTITLGDLIASSVGKFGEKTVLKRAVCYNVKESVIISSFAHPATTCPTLFNATLGKYGGLLAIRPRFPIEINMLKDIGHKLCKHIVGMNPLSVGSFNEEDELNLEQKYEQPIEKSLNNEFIETKSYIKYSDEKLDFEHTDKTQDVEKTDDDPSSDSESEDDEIISQRNLIEVNETRLLYQPFLLNPDCTVGEVVKSCGFEVIDFQRFECGEKFSD